MLRIPFPDRDVFYDTSTKKSTDVPKEGAKDNPEFADRAGKTVQKLFEGAFGEKKEIGLIEMEALVETPLGKMSPSLARRCGMTISSDMSDGDEPAYRCPECQRLGIPSAKRNVCTACANEGKGKSTEVKEALEDECESA